MRSLSIAVIAAFFVSQAAAHGGVTSYVIGGTTYPGWQPYNSPTGQKSIGRPYSSYDPIYQATASTIHCNNNGQASGGQLSATVAAGTAITASGRTSMKQIDTRPGSRPFRQWTHAEGPVMVYMAKCPGSCSSANSASLTWFKIAETGLKSGTLAKGQWGNGDIMATLSYTTNIPSFIAAGEYLIRHELLALHQANTPQFYPECGQLIVTGGGGQSPPSRFTGKFPGLYSQNDPGIMVDIYSTAAQTTTTYKVPGPPVWKGETS